MTSSIMSRRTRIVAAVAALGLLAAACSVRTGTTGSSTVYDVVLRDFSIDGPATVEPGPATFKVANNGKAPHTLAIKTGDAVLATPELAGGEQANLALPALKAGSYTLYCSVPGHREAGMQATLTVGADNSSGHNTMTAAEMEGVEEAVIKAFPAKTAGVGGAVLAPTMEDGVKVFSLSVQAVRWEVAPGEFVDGFGYNGVVPGPQLRARRGDLVKVVVHNEMPQSTTVHFHGLTVPNAMDGVPYITQDPIRAGESFTYRFRIVDQPGTYMYHSHFNALEQVGKGLLGAFIVEPEQPSWDVESAVLLGDGEMGYTINGKGFPATAPIVAERGERVLLRFANAGQIIHPMHLHGFHFRVVARDGEPVAPYIVDTLSIAPGERYDAMFVANLKGTWAFHCHILSHVEGSNGMHGMATAVVVT